MAINKKTPGDCGYIALYRGKRAELYAKDLAEAKELAVLHFNAKGKKRYDVSVHLAENKGGQEVVHIAVD